MKPQLAPTMVSITTTAIRTTTHHGEQIGNSCRWASGEWRRRRRSREARGEATRKRRTWRRSVGLKSGDFSNVSSPSAPRAGGYNGKGKSFRYYSRDAEDIFAEFFGDGSENWDGKKSDVAGGGGINVRRTAKKEAAVETQLACSLENLYKGSKRKMKISRIVSDDLGCLF
ncbi:hypothetical protein V2J09_021380 [Rumex salicifolius]